MIFKLHVSAMKIAFFIVNREDSDEMPHSVASHLDLHCLSKFHCMAPQSRKC